MELKWQPDGMTIWAILNVAALIVLFAVVNLKIDKFIKNGQIEISEVKSDVFDLNLRLEFLHEELNKTSVLMENYTCILRSGHTVSELEEETNEDGDWVWDLNVSIEIETLLVNQRIGEFEAGWGCYGRFFLRLKFFANHSILNDKCSFDNRTVQSALVKSPKKVADWKGFGSFMFASSATGGLVKYVDLSAPVLLSEKFHWIISFRIDEKLEEQYQKIFMSNVARHACQGIIIAWSFPWLPDIKNNDYIVEEMDKNGFIHDSHLTRWLQKKAFLTILKKKLLVFRRRKPLPEDLCRSFPHKTVFFSKDVKR